MYSGTLKASSPAHAAVIILRASACYFAVSLAFVPLSHKEDY